MIGCTYYFLDISIHLNVLIFSPQINVAAETQRNLESLLGEINVNIDKTRTETTKQVVL